jgi:para-nitrobenzyl esterase
VKLIPRLATAAAVCLFSTAATAAPLQVDGGRIAGASAGGLNVYKGVPYAAPPLGALRWKPPQPVPAWSGVRAADTFAPACMQSGVSMPGEVPPKVSEDCLYLNIWAPLVRSGAPLPVMVFIYGGGFTNGSAAMPLYWGDRLARKGVIVVSFGYRVGALGYLATSALSKESPDHMSGDYGLLDQIAALQWVRRNIGAFGGDPNRVTLFGQSAGAMSISLLAASPWAKGLFHGVIAESGGVFEPVELAPAWKLSNAETAGDAYTAMLGAKSLAELRTLPAERFLGPGSNAVSHPVFGAGVLPRSPYAVFAAGEQADVPTMVGSNEEEARSLVDLSTVKAATFKKDIQAAWGTLPSALLDAYPHATDAEAKTARADFERDLRFGWDMWTWARLQAATGRSAVFFYHFTRKPPFPHGSVYDGWGASHFAELWYVFDHLGQEPWAWTSADEALAKAMSDYWTNFAKTGDPNSPNLPVWPKFGASNQVLDFGDHVTAGGVADLPSLSTFDAVYAQVRGAPVVTRPSAPPP